jgi:predicted permease
VIRIFRRLLFWLRRSERDAEMREELATHRALIEQDLRGRGVPDSAARDAARRAMGNETYMREESRAVWSWRWLSTLGQDLRYGVRSLRRAPGFAAVAVLTLALGIGANSAMFSVVDALLFRPPPGVRDPTQVVRLQIELQSRGSDSPGMSDLISYPDLADLRENGSRLGAIAAFVRTTKPIGDGETAESEPAILASGNYFDVLGVQPAIGRLLNMSDDRDNAANAVAVLSWSYWQRAYSGAPSVLGRSIRVAGRPFTIVGVAGKHFAGSELGAPALWVPLGNAWQLGYDAELRRMRFGVWLSAVARLGPDVSRVQATDAARLALQLGRAGLPAGGKVPDGSSGPRVTLTSLAGIVRGANGEPRATSQRVLPVSLWFLAVTGIVLLIACANVANLLLARGAQRAHEIAVRTSIGATRRRLLRQLLTENVLLAALGAVAGLLFAAAGTALLPRAIPLPTLPPLFSGRLLTFTVVLTCATIVLFGITPALRSARANLLSALSGRSPSGTRSRLRHILVVVQIGASVVLLVSAGLFIRSMRNVEVIDPGFAVQQLLAVSTDTRSAPLTTEESGVFWGRALERVRQLDGVDAAALGAVLPFEEVYMTPVSEPGGTGALAAQPDFADAAYFATVGIPMREGRPFTVADQHPSAAPVVIVNQTLARQLFQGTSALGRCIRAGPIPRGATCAQIVGVVADANFADVTREPGPVYYRPLGARDQGWGTVLHVRTRRDPAELAGAVRRELLALDKSLLYVRVRPLTDLLAPQLVPWRTGTFIFGLFGSVGLILAAIGLYGVIALLVAQRAHEVGIRMALGARRGDVVRLILNHGARLLVAGLVVGTLGAAAASRFFRAMMYGVSALDPIAYLGTALVLTIVALLALMIPMRRATKVDPMVTLRVQ